jgi:hypothetical protein
MAYRLALLISVMALAIFGAARFCHASEFDAGQHFSVAIHACAADGHCEHFKRPLEADTELQCMTGAMFGAAAWAGEHPGWALREFHCAKDGEANL